MRRRGVFPPLLRHNGVAYHLCMTTNPSKPSRILLFVRRVMPDASEDELIAASDRVRQYAAFVIRLQQRIERDRQAAIRRNGDDGVDSDISPRL